MDRETADEIKRFVKILFEDIGQKLQLLAEGQHGVQQKVERVDQSMKALEETLRYEIVETRAIVKLSFSELDRRLSTLEQNYAAIEQRLTRIERAS